MVTTQRVYKIKCPETKSVTPHHINKPNIKINIHQIYSHTHLSSKLKSEHPANHQTNNSAIKINQEYTKN
jgi:hypothetical protein